MLLDRGRADDAERASALAAMALATARELDLPKVAERGHALIVRASAPARVAR